MRYGIASATFASRTAWGVPARDRALAITLGGIDAAGACSARDIRGDVGGSGAVSAAFT